MEHVVDSAAAELVAHNTADCSFGIAVAVGELVGALTAYRRVRRALARTRQNAAAGKQIVVEAEAPFASAVALEAPGWAFAQAAAPEAPPQLRPSFSLKLAAFSAPVPLAALRLRVQAVAAYN